MLKKKEGKQQDAERGKGAGGRVVMESGKLRQVAELKSRDEESSGE